MRRDGEGAVPLRGDCDPEQQQHDIQAADPPERKGGPLAKPGRLRPGQLPQRPAGDEVCTAGHPRVLLQVQGRQVLRSFAVWRGQQGCLADRRPEGSLGPAHHQVQQHPPPGEEFSYVNHLWSLWSNIRQDYLSDCTLPIWKNIVKFATQYIGGLFGSKKRPRNSICDHTPLYFYLNDTFGHLVEPYKNETYVKMKREITNNSTLEIKRREVLVSAVRYEDGEYVSWNSSSTKLPDLINATLASTSVPVAFSPVNINGSHYMDGGVVMNMNIEHSIQACFRLGLAKRQEDVVIDAIETFPDTGSKVSDDDPATENQEITFTKLLSRSFSILHSQVRGLKLLKNVLCRYPKINLRYYISPSIEEYEQFPKNAFDGNNLTGILHMLRSGLQKGWNNNFTSINECIFDTRENPSSLVGSELFQMDE
ncbi:secreted alpha beta hydrolase-like protein [Cryptosporidium canis]|nr:secreted alpha beta hydrolase-like protein [Cryptosporidium canis]